MQTIAPPFWLVPGETAHRLETGETVVVKVTAHPPKDEPRFVALQVDADVCDPETGATLIDLPPHPVAVPLDVAADGEAFAGVIDDARERALDRVRTKLAALAAVATLPQTPMPGQSARRQG